jgi:ABC-type transport system involved in multi-copper enzyme maturation permease subunit
VNRLLLAELYKVLTTKLWWVLLIPVVVIAGAIGFTGAAIADLPAVLEETGTSAPAVALTLPISMKQATVFALILGLIGGAGEFRHKTITTTYLTGSSRGTVLAAKVITYAGLGLLYGVATFAFCALGALASSGTDSFPSAADTLAIAAAGCAAVIMWSVLGVGIGTLASNQVVVLIVALVYTLFFEGLLSLVLRIPRLGLDGVPPYLPGSGSEALQTDHGITTFARTFGEEAFVVRGGLEALVGTSGQLSWLAGGVLFAGYTAAFVAGGWLAGRQRDIT